MEIDKSQIKAIFEFTPDKFILVYSDHRGLGKEWALNTRIDRSYKGKDDDIGSEVIYVSDEDAEKLKRNGFSVIEI